MLANGDSSCMVKATTVVWFSIQVTLRFVMSSAEACVAGRADMLVSNVLRTHKTTESVHMLLIFTDGAV